MAPCTLLVPRHPAGTVAWWGPHVPRWEVLPDNTLRIRRLQVEDEGTYTCMADNSVGRAEASGTLTVHAGAITITAVQASDAGHYLCQAISVAGSVLARARLQVTGALVEHPPLASPGPANRTVLLVGATVWLPCRVGGGDPPASVGWLKDGSALVGAQPRASLLENGTLQITGLRVTDSGHYECVATSSVGETRWGGSLEVQEEGSSLSPPPPQSSVLPRPPSTPVVTNITQTSVTLSWQGNEDSNGTNVTSYIVEAFSQVAGGPWQTVATDVKGDSHTVSGLVPDTIYLFLVRAVNAHGLSDPSGTSEPVRTQAPSPTSLGPDPQEVQRDLARVAVHLQEPVVLPAGAVRLSWTVERPPPFLQGYRVLFRWRGGRWEEARAAPGERGLLLTHLRRGQDYEVKVRPFFQQLYGPDSAVRALRTPEAAPSAPPRAVSVAGNGTSVRISWQPPPPAEQNGVIRDYQIWCLGNESRFHINQSVEGTVLATVLRGLVPGVPYHAEVAAATSAGVGARSVPIPIRIGANGKMRGHPVNPPVVTWTELLPPPPSASELSHCAQEEEEEDEEEDAARGLGTEEWYPSENIPCVTIASSPTSSTATLTPSPHTAEDAPHLRDLQSPRLPR
ncbi:roundabout-like protein 2 [Columba livia]|nr:roundabout-like protein 2 [Columba livia]